MGQVCIICWSIFIDLNEKNNKQPSHVFLVFLKTIRLGSQVLGEISGGSSFRASSPIRDPLVKPHPLLLFIYYHYCYGVIIMIMIVFHFLYLDRFTKAIERGIITTNRRDRGTIALGETSEFIKSNASLLHHIQGCAAIQHVLCKPPPWALPQSVWLFIKKEGMIIVVL